MKGSEATETTQAPYQLLVLWGLEKVQVGGADGKFKVIFSSKIAQSKVCLSAEIFRRTRYHVNQPLPGTFLNAAEMWFKLVCRLNL